MQSLVWIKSKTQVSFSRMHRNKEMWSFNHDLISCFFLGLFWRHRNQLKLTQRPAQQCEIVFQGWEVQECRRKTRDTTRKRGNKRRTLCELRPSFHQHASRSSSRYFQSQPSQIPRELRSCPGNWRPDPYEDACGHLPQFENDKCFPNQLAQVYT